jgi:hypothetical protein
MLTRETTLDEVQTPNGGLWSVWKGRIGATPKTENGEVVKDENGNVEYDLDPTITENYGTASLRFFVYGANGKIATEEVNFTIEKGLPIYLDMNDLTTTTSAELLLEQILAVVNSLQTTDNGLRYDIEILRNELGVHVGVLTSDIAEVSKNVNDLSEQAVKATDKGVPNGVASLDGVGKIPQEQLPGSLDPNAYKWKLLGETEITQQMIDEAGNEGIPGVVIDLGEPITKWYGETWVRVEFDAAKTINSANAGMNCQFGASVNEALVDGGGESRPVLVGAQVTGIAPLYFEYKNAINLFSTWKDACLYGTQGQSNGYGALSYPLNSFATSIGDKHYTIKGCRYLGFFGRKRAFKFPVGCKIELYGRFPE